MGFLRPSPCPPWTGPTAAYKFIATDASVRIVADVIARLALSNVDVIQ
jgi:hypothetical protein